MLDQWLTGREDACGYHAKISKTVNIVGLYIIDAATAATVTQTS